MDRYPSQNPLNTNYHIDGLQQLTSPYVREKKGGGMGKSAAAEMRFGATVRRFANASGIARRLRAALMSVALCAGMLLVAAIFAAPAQALTCPGATGADSNSDDAIKVTYYLTASACLTGNPGSGVLMSAHIDDSSATVTFTSGVNVATSFTTGPDCTSSSAETTGNVAAYKYGAFATCTTTVRLQNGGEFSFVAQTDSGSYAHTLSNVAFSVPPTTTVITSAPNPSSFGSNVTFTATVSGGVNAPSGSVDFRDGATSLRSPGLTDAGSTPGAVSIASSLYIEGTPTCAVTTTGGVKCWGANNYGQLGNGNNTPSLTPVDVIGLDNGVVAVGAGAHFGCALTTAGGVKCWGRNTGGRLGNGGTENTSTPVDVVDLTTGVVAIAVGSIHACALTNSGGVKCWGGDNSEGQLGNGNNMPSATPVNVSGLDSGVRAISAGGSRTCAIMAATGAAKCWGSNNDGGLGNNSIVDANSPQNVTNMASGVSMISVGPDHTCAVRTTGEALCWGGNATGRLGDGSLERRLVPTQVSGLDSGVSSISAGYLHTCAVMATGGAKCWGQNAYGQLGVDTTTQTLRLTPGDVTKIGSPVKAIVAGSFSTYAITTGLGALSWGRNEDGRLGDGWTNDRPIPGNVSGMVGGRAHSSLNTSALSAGNHSITANYSGDGSRTGSTSPVLTQVVNKAVTTIAMAISPASSSTFGEPVTLTATVTSAGGTPGGSVTFVSDVSGTLGTAPLNSSGVATLSTSALLGGTRTIGAAFDGNDNFLGSGTSQSYTVNKAPTTTTLTTLPASSGTFGEAVTLKVKVESPNGTPRGFLTLADSEKGDLGSAVLHGAGVAEMTVYGLSAGEHTFSVTYEGFRDFLGSSATKTYTVNKAANVITFPALANTVFGAAPPTPAARASSRFPISYASTTTSVCTTTSAGAITLVSVGSCSITASQAGNANYVAAAPVSQSFSVTKGTNTITFPALANTVFGAAPPAPAATASSGLAVSYASTTAAVCTATSAGVITLVSVGSCSITASQAGNANYAAAAPVVRAFNVTPAATSTAVATSGSPSVFGTSVTFTATVSASAGGTPSGSVTFKDGTAALGVRTLSGGTASFSTSALGGGSHSITADYGGSATHAASVSGAITQIITKAATTASLTATPNPAPVNSSVTLRAAVSGAGVTGNVAFRNGTATIATVALSNGQAATTFTPSTEGSLPLSAVYAGDTSFTGSTSNTVPLVTYTSCTDAFVSGRALPGSNGSVFGSTASATGETGEPNHAGNSGALNSVWCKWTAPVAGQVTFDTTGSSFDTTLAVYRGAAVNALTLVAANDNIQASNRHSRVSFNATAGVTYRVAVDGVSSTGTYVLNFAQAATAPTTFAAVLPTARSITTADTATAFATIINGGAAAANGCSIALPPGFPAGFSYRATNAANAPVGPPDTPLTIAPGAAQGFVFAVTPLIALNSADLALVFDCANTPVTVTTSGLNTLLLSSSPTPVPDLISIGATPSNNGILAIPGTSGANAFAAAAVNIGTGGSITATIDDNGRGLALIPRLCVTNPATGACVNPASPAVSATFTLANNATATIAVFVTATGAVPFDPANNRLFLRFKTTDGVTRGATSVAVRTQ